ncbi:uncharacterized protein LOC141854745 [Brevipalpus obovatus]|uniref:uncharacterized protein LOC141854745 n=1 Tax=Brevipalpus obovatus TaxID=246614 RepID=UPI003D9E50D7
MLPVILIFVSLISSSYTQTETGVECANCKPPKYTEHYVAKGCTPVIDERCPNCIISYQCPQDNSSSNSNKCLYGGKSYDVGQLIDTIGPCQQCTCFMRPDSNETWIACLHIECPEQLAGPQVLLQYVNYTIDDPQKCYLIYEPNVCCGTLRCPRSKEVGQPHTCRSGDTTYREGERMYIGNCRACTCRADLDVNSTSDNGACHKESCYMDIDMLKRGCVPVYVEDGCCAIQYHCPHPSLEERQNHCRQEPHDGACNPSSKYRFDDVQKKCKQFTYTACGGDMNVFEDDKSCMKYCTERGPSPAEPVKGKCYFNGTNYDVGSVLETEPQYACKCQLPPDFTCIMRS